MGAINHWYLVKNIIKFEFLIVFLLFLNFNIQILISMASNILWANKVAFFYFHNFLKILDTFSRIDLLVLLLLGCNLLLCCFGYLFFLLVQFLLLGSLRLSLIIGLLSPDLFNAFVNHIVLMNELLMTRLELTNIADFIVDLL